VAVEHRELEPAIRPITGEDVDAVVAACAWLFAPPASVPDLWDPLAARERLVRLCTAPRSIAFVADLDGGIIGFCTVYLDVDSLRFGQRAWLNDMAVDPRHRSRGVGRHLLQYARAWARERGATQLLLDSSTTRTDAHRFYRRESPTFEATCFGWRL
jgi:GNAT superfamily N-acetyltransferase